MVVGVCVIELDGDAVDVRWMWPVMLVGTLLISPATFSRLRPSLRFLSLVVALLFFVPSSRRPNRLVHSVSRINYVLVARKRARSCIG